MTTDDSKKSTAESEQHKKTTTKSKSEKTTARSDKSAAKKQPKQLEPGQAEARANEAQNRIILDSAGRVAERIGARLFFLILEEPGQCKIPEKILKRKDFVLAVPAKLIDDDLKKQYKSMLPMPTLQLTRLGKIKMADMRSLSAHMLSHGDKIVCVTGSRSMSVLDAMLVLDIGKEFELLGSQEISNISTQVRTEVFEELVTISSELANQGREGKPVGAIFVLGDTDKVMQLSRQMVFNPFHGYPEEERNILDPTLHETIKEFASIDGAFIVRDDGVIMSSGRHLNASLENENLPQGLGARHAAAAGITSVTNATAIAISESTGMVRIFRNGKIFMELEKAAPNKR
ncbi:MAG: diadenylate cyclase [bacterium]